MKENLLIQNKVVEVIVNRIGGGENLDRYYSKRYMVLNICKIKRL